ncbi:MAG: hypothetical protein AAF826_11080 [Pseudomonadota bacterium]
MRIKFELGQRDEADDLVHLFKETFNASEGAEEGEAVACLAHNVLDSTADADL